MTNGLHVPDELKQMIMRTEWARTGSYHTDALWEKDLHSVRLDGLRQ